AINGWLNGATKYTSSFTARNGSQITPGGIVEYLKGPGAVKPTDESHAWLMTLNPAVLYNDKISHQAILGVVNKTGARGYVILDYTLISFPEMNNPWVATSLKSAGSLKEKEDAFDYLQQAHFTIFVVGIWYRPAMDDGGK